MTSFTLLTEHEVRKLIEAMPKKSCALDPMPTPLLVACIDTLLPVLTKIINLSLQNGIFADQWKCASVQPCWRSSDWNRIFRISDQSVIYNIFPNLQKRLCSYRHMVRWSPITSIQSCSRLIMNTIAQRRPCSKSWTMFFWKWTHNTWPCWSFWILVRRLTRSIIPPCWIGWPRLLACRVKR